jgi:hypothetical protein
MRTAIFETDHFEVAHTLIRLFQLPGNELTVFSYSSSWQQLQLMPGMEQQVKWVIKEESESKAAFILKMYRLVKKERIELLYLETITDNFIFYAWLVKALPAVKIILTIHDINSFFYYKNNGTLRRWLRNAGKKRLIDAVEEFTVINSTMQWYLQRLLPSGKTVRYIPGAFFDNANYSLPAAPLLPFRIVVPGSVDNRRRDYTVVFALLEICRKWNIPVQITLLGGFHAEHGAEILKQCREYGKENNNLHWFEEQVVDHPLFNRVMQEAHFILAPCVIHTVISDEVAEVYGESLSSGNIGDIIRFARPAIIPAALKTGEEISQVACRYTSVNDIAEQLKLLRDDPDKYLILQEAALKGSGEFTLEKIRAKYPDLFMVSS